MARLAHACTHTTFAPDGHARRHEDERHPRPVELEVDIRTLPGPDRRRGARDAASRRSATSPTASSIESNDDPSTASPIDTPLWDSLVARHRPAGRGTRRSCRSSWSAAPTTGSSVAPARSATGSALFSRAARRSRTTPRCSTATTSGSTSESLGLSEQLWEAVAHDLLDVTRSSRVRRAAVSSACLAVARPTSRLSRSGRRSGNSTSPATYFTGAVHSIVATTRGPVVDRLEVAGRQCRRRRTARCE